MDTVAFAESWVAAWNARDLEAVLATVNGLTIVYRNDRHQLVAETLLFGDDGLVHRGFAAYSKPG